MRKVLAIAAALMIAVAVIMPALGYTNQAAGNQTYSISAGDKLQNYSLVAMTPAHSLTPDMIVNKFSFQSAGIKSTRMPYSFKASAAPVYSIKIVGADSATALGAAASKQAALLGSLNKQEQAAPVAAAETPEVPEVVAETPAVVEPVVAEAPAVNETEVVAEAPAVNETEVVAEAPAVVEPVVAEAVAVNETEVVAEAPAVNETEVAAAAPVAGPYVIMGMAQDNDQAPLEGWNFNLSKDGAVVDSATSGVDGKFNFVGLTSGVYTVTETLEEGWSAVSPENGTVDVTIADASVTDLVFVNQKA
ncbi:MAG TPA: SpaA isopeptide-forming pilin-related protein [Methanothrix sp.]|nr:SpaA isopeptide-forming pilin-related protein [Methanothrix sp.]